MQYIVCKGHLPCPVTRQQQLRKIHVKVLLEEGAVTRGAFLSLKGAVFILNALFYFQLATDLGLGMGNGYV